MQAEEVLKRDNQTGYEISSVMILDKRCVEVTNKVERQQLVEIYLRTKVFIYLT